MKSRTLSCAIVLTLALGALRAVYANSASWNLNPTNGDWNTATNWTPQTVPNGPTDVATFAGSSITGLTLSAETTEVAAIVFNAGGSSFNITADPESTQTDVTMTISGTGIINNSGVTQNLAAAQVSGPDGFIDFVNGASARYWTALTALGATTNGLYHGGFISFNRGAGTMLFIGNATAANAIFTLNGSTTSSSPPANIVFIGIFGDICTAANGFFTVNGGQRPGTSGGSVFFNGFNGTQVVSAGRATLINNGGNGRDSVGGQTAFLTDWTTASQATLVANGGVNGTIAFYGNSDGGEARIELFSNGLLDLTNTAEISLGSIEGDGLIKLGANRTESVSCRVPMRHWPRSPKWKSLIRICN